MKKFLLAAIPCALFTTFVQAESYQSISHAGVTHTSTDVKASNLATMSDSSNVWAVDTTYYFDKKVTLGPLNEFEYINHVSNVRAAYLDAENANIATIGGDYFHGKFVVGGDFAVQPNNMGDFNAWNAKFGYLLTNDLLLNIRHENGKNQTAETFFGAQYNHKLNDTDYVGVTAEVDNGFDNYTVSSKYFASLNMDNFVAVGLTYQNTEFDTNWVLDTRYYFDRNTSVFANIDLNDDNYTVGGQYFFDKNYALSASYTTVQMNDGVKVDSDVYNLTFTAQF